MIDLEIKKTLSELYDFLNPDCIQKINSHLLSLSRKIEDLSVSRDKWKEKYTNLKNSLVI